MKVEAAQLKILFLISTMGHGRGGHFSSLKVTAESLAKFANCAILNVGVAPSDALEKSGVNYHFIYCNGLNFLACFLRIFRFIRHFEPDVLHSFDVSAHFWARIFRPLSGTRMVHTKCGGPNPDKYYPAADEVVLFSKENLDYFSAKKRFRDSTLHLIPNRTEALSCDRQRIDALKEACGHPENIFLRISRFAPAYERSLHQAINLVEEINLAGSKKYSLLLLGAIQDRDVYNRVASRAGNNIHLVTEDRFTYNASELIDIADFVIGTGRGFMEASSLGKVMLAPVSNSEYPVLVNEANFDHFFERNFSPRAAPEKLSGPTEVLAAIEDPQSVEELQSFSLKVFRAHFSIDSAIEKYLALYRGVSSTRGLRVGDFFLHSLVSMRNYFYASRGGRRA